MFDWPLLAFSVALSVSLVTIFLLRKWSRRTDRTTLLGWPLFGSSHRFTSGRVIQTIQAIARLGPMVDIFNGIWRITVLSDVNDVREVLLHRPRTFRRVARAIQGTGLEHGIFISEGAKWSIHRRVVAPPFSKLNVSRLLDKILVETNTLVHRLHAMDGEVIDFTRLASEFTIAVIGRVAFDLGTDTCGGDYFHSMAFRSDIGDLLSFAAMNSLSTLPPILARCSPAFYRSEEKAVKASHRLKRCAMELIDFTKTVDKGVRQTETFIRAISRALDEGKLSLEEVLSDIVTLFVAGTDTTAIGISWALYHLSFRPDIQDCIRKEVDSFKGGDAASLMSSLQLCRACFKEALRMQGPVAFLPMRTVGNDEVLLTSGRVVRPSDTLWLSLDAVSNDPEVFQQPGKYDPYRWLTDDIERLESMQRYFVTFGGGPRVCPGMDLALSEGTFVIARIVSNFKFELCCSPEEVQRIHRGTASISKMPLKFYHPSSSSGDECTGNKYSMSNFH